MFFYFVYFSLGDGNIAWQ